MAENQLPFLEKINRKYSAKAGSLFLIHGNINDIFTTRDGSWKPLMPLLLEEFSKKNRIFVHIDLSSGFKILPVWPSSVEDLDAKARTESANLAILRRQHQKSQIEMLRRAINAEQENIFETLEKESIQSSFAALLLAKTIFETTERNQEKDGWRIIFIINDLGAMAPAQSEGNLSESDRRNIQFLHKWFNTSEFLNSRHVVIMTSESADNVSPKIKNLPQVNHIRIGRPSNGEREKFIKAFLLESGETVALDQNLDINDLVEATAGLTLRDLEQLLRITRYGGTKERPSILNRESTAERAREVMEQSAGGHIEFLNLDYGLEKVVGQDRLKARLAKQAKIFRKGSRSATPNGILVPGPNGSGKSFIMKAFAKETGWHVIRLKNIRNMWYGETERIWELIEDIIEVIGRVIIMVDEGDTELGGRGQNVHEVDKRLFGKILRMMEDKNNKGRVCWVIITARPDKLEPDIKRSGRAGRHYPIFAPETLEEQEKFMELAVLAKFGLDFTMCDKSEKLKLLGLTGNYYPADFDLLVEQLEEIKESSADNQPITLDDIIEEARAIRPSDPVLQRKLQICVALLECTDDRLVPEQYRELVKNREGLVQKIIELKRLTGELI